jgi:peroxiredoxin
MLSIKQSAPAFNALDQHHQVVKLADFKAVKQVVLYFYPKDDTPGCTIEANDFTRLSPEFAKHDCVIIGVSKDSCDSHRAFSDKYGLSVVLLADVDGSICSAYGVWQEKEKNGEKKMGIVRSTFVIDKQGKLAYAQYGVNANGHAQAVLDTLKSL